MPNPPTILILAGPNGAGKSTSASVVVRNKACFVNADDIARELPDTDRDHAEIKASRLALSMLDRLGDERQDFALETTLASRSLVPRIQALKVSGYEFQLIFFWLPAVDLAIKRVESRVRMGGHNIPEKTIRRRYVSGLENFFARYQPIADVWRAYANTNLQAPVLVAEGRLRNTIHIYDHEIWEQMQAACGEEKM
ncbi:MAG: hypothetical protein JWQ02_4497, partial [Capsulimonas sp.]|nr:hypothetical protein [Capsulimonas sp.]